MDEEVSEWRPDVFMLSLVKPGNGWLIPSDDEIALQATLTIALSDPLKLRKMGEDSYKIVQNEINIDQMVNTFIVAVNKTSMTGLS